MGKAIKSITKAVGGLVGSLLGSSTPSLDLPAPAAAEIPQATRADEATVKLGADSLEDQIKRTAKSRSTFSSLGGSSSGISI